MPSWGFRGTIDSLYLLLWVLEPMLCQQHGWLVSSSFFIISFFWDFLFKRPQLTFSFWGVLKGWPLVFLLSKLLDSTFFKSNFWLLFPLSFSPSELILSYQVKSFPATFLHGFSFWVPRGISLLFMNCWFPILLILFLHQWVVDRGISVLVSCISWHALLNCLNPSLALLHVSRIPGISESPGILA